MKPKLISAVLLLAGLLSLQACYYDHPPEAAPIDPEDISFQTHIVPIFQKSCSTANCHDGTMPPDLRANAAWGALQSGGYINSVIPTQSILYRTVEYIETPMPPGGPQLSELDRLLILTWIEKGSPND